MEYSPGEEHHTDRFTELYHDAFSRRDKLNRSALKHEEHYAHQP